MQKLFQNTSLYWCKRVYISIGWIDLQGVIHRKLQSHLELPNSRENTVDSSVNSSRVAVSRSAST